MIVGTKLQVKTTPAFAAGTRVAVVSNGTERRLAMKTKHSYQVDVRITFIISDYNSRIDRVIACGKRLTRRPQSVVETSWATTQRRQ